MEILSFLDLSSPATSPSRGMDDELDGNQAGCHGKSAGKEKPAFTSFIFLPSIAELGGGLALFSSPQQKPKAQNDVSTGIYYS